MNKANGFKTDCHNGEHQPVYMFWDCDSGSYSSGCCVHCGTPMKVPDRKFTGSFSTDDIDVDGHGVEFIGR